MASDVAIHDLALSFLWIETLPDLLDAGASPGAPMAFLRSGGQYAEVFDKLLAGEKVPNRLSLSWRKLIAQRFWTNYFRRNGKEPVRGSNSWRNLVPFRWKLPLTVKTTWHPPVEIKLEGYLFPHGVSLAVNTGSKETLTLEQTADLGHRIRHGGRFNLSGGGFDAKNLPLNAVADAGLKTLREAALGPDALPGIRFDQDPYSIVTVLNASGKDAAAEPPEGQEVHLALNALSNWPGNWREAKPDALAQARRETSSEMKSNCVLYTTRRGQAVWCPVRFGGGRSLLCYHCNQVFALMQTESLCGLVSAAAAVIREQGPAKLLGAFRECTELAAGLLGALYGGARNTTYCSSAIPRHIQENERVKDIELVRRELLENETPLHSSRQR